MIDEQILRDLGFEKSDKDWRPLCWVLNTQRGTMEYRQVSVSARHADGRTMWVLCIWSGLGAGENYGYRVEQPDVDTLRNIVSTLSA